MDNQTPFTTTPEERAQRRAQRIAARRERERRRRRKMLLCLLPILALIAAAGFGISRLSGGSGTDVPADTGTNAENTLPVISNNAVTCPMENPEQEGPYTLSPDENTAQMPGNLSSQYAILIDLNRNRILAEKNAHTVVSPASMTKILTVLVAAEAIDDESKLEDTVTIDLEITDYAYVNDCSPSGFLLNEPVPVRDLFYGTILPSGGDAALALARYVAGSQEEFVKLMNRKVAELGLSSTASFTNCIGLYDEKNVCTVYDMALILKAAMENDLCRQVLTAKTYEIPVNDFHPEGLILSNWFLRKIEDHVSEGLEVLGAKTGYVTQSGNCSASYAETADGGRYICVTADASGSWACIKDHVAIYEQFCIAS